MLFFSPKGGTDMKKWSIFLFLIFILSGCGGGDRNDPTFTVSLKVDLSDTQNNPLTGETIHIQGPNGINFSCQQNPTQANPNDPTKCDVPAAGTGNTAVPITFKSLPADNSSYTFTDASATSSRSGSCQVTIVDSSHLASAGNTVSSDSRVVTCDQIGSGAPNPLRMTITLL